VGVVYIWITWCDRGSAAIFVAYLLSKDVMSPSRRQVASAIHITSFFDDNPFVIEEIEKEEKKHDEGQINVGMKHNIKLS
jgi:hypothetical protein